jgi:hypothetical protein
LSERPQILGGRDQQFGIVPEHAQALIAFGTEQTTPSIGPVMVIDRERLEIAAKSDGLGLTANSADSALSHEHDVVFGDGHAEAASKSVRPFFIVRGPRSIVLLNPFKALGVIFSKMRHAHFSFALFAMLFVTAARRGSCALLAVPIGGHACACQKMNAVLAGFFWRTICAFNTQPSAERVASYFLPREAAFVMFQICSLCGGLCARSAAIVVSFTHFFKNMCAITAIRFIHTVECNAFNAARQGI